MPLEPVRIFVDGSQHRTFGGVGCVFLYREKASEFAVGFRDAQSNQTMELMAATIGLMMLKPTWQGKPVVVVSDSAYVVNCFQQGWIENWRRNDWKNYKNKPVANREMWETLDAWVSLFQTEFQKVKGHSGNIYNERADRLASAAREAMRDGRPQTHRGLVPVQELVQRAPVRNARGRRDVQRHR